MATLPASVNAEYGITTELTGYTIENESITDSPVRETVHDQKNRVAKELEYDIRYDLSLTVRGATKPAIDSFSYNSNKWIVDSIENAGAYNGLRRFNIKAHRFTNCDTATKVS